jgi:hypothetical protein
MFGQTARDMMLFSGLLLVMAFGEFVHAGDFSYRYQLEVTSDLGTDWSVGEAQISGDGSTAAWVERNETAAGGFRLKFRRINDLIAGTGSEVLVDEVLKGEDLALVEDGVSDDGSIIVYRKNKEGEEYARYIAYDTYSAKGREISYCVECIDLGPDNSVCFLVKLNYFNNTADREIFLSGDGKWVIGFPLAFFGEGNVYSNFKMGGIMPSLLMGPKSNS